MILMRRIAACLRPSWMIFSELSHCELKMDRKRFSDIQKGVFYIFFFILWLQDSLPVYTGLFYVCVLSFQRPQTLDLTGFRPFQILFFVPTGILHLLHNRIRLQLNTCRQRLPTAVTGSRIPLSLPMMYNCFSNVFSKLNSYGTKVRILKNRDMWRCQK